MIRLPSPPDPEVAFGLRLLADVARLIPLRGPAAAGASGHAVVEIRIGEREIPGDVGPEDLPRAIDGSVRVEAGLARRAARWVGLADEQTSPERDRHGRVPSEESAPVRAGLESRPVVMEWAEALRAAAFRAAGSRPFWTAAPWPGGARWAAALTHDVDVVGGWQALAALRAMELARGGNPRLAARVVGAALRNLAGDPVQATVRHILETERRVGARGTWFLLCGDPTLRSVRRKDVTYRVEGRGATAVLDLLRADDAEIGLHGSFETAERPGLHDSQRRRLESASGRPAPGVRQHFLRLRLPGSFHDMAAAGFEYDSTLGFPDRPGFRLGVSDVVPLRDSGRQETIGIDEVPFAWMDRSGSKYGGVEDPTEWVRGALETADTVRRHEGVWVGIWHPYLADALGYPGAPAAFERLADGLAERRPWFAPLAGIVRWRRWRRSLCAEATSDDVPRILGPAAGSATLEGPGGETREVPVTALATSATMG